MTVHCTLIKLVDKWSKQMADIPPFFCAGPSISSSPWSHVNRFFHTVALVDSDCLYLVRWIKDGSHSLWGSIKDMTLLGPFRCDFYTRELFLPHTASYLTTLIYLMKSIKSVTNDLHTGLSTVLSMFLFRCSDNIEQWTQQLLPHQVRVPGEDHLAFAFFPHLIKTPGGGSCAQSCVWRLSAAKIFFLLFLCAQGPLVGYGDAHALEGNVVLPVPYRRLPYCRLLAPLDRPLV